jgi:MFS family permease
MPGVQPAPDSPYAAMRLGVALALMTIGNGTMYLVPVVLPSLQAEFGISRADASLPYTLQMICFGLGGMLMGRLADRRGIMVPLLISAASIGVGFVAAAMSTNILTFSLAHGILLGLFGSSAMFAPLIADTSLWFVKRRGIAVAVCASGNYLAGTIWPPITQYFVEAAGWRQTYIGFGVFCAVTLAALALAMRRRPPAFEHVEQVRKYPATAPDRAVATSAAAAAPPRAVEIAQNRPFGLSPIAAQTLLCIAGLACCTAMAMPQVHIVAYCGDLGYGTARGAQMLSLMLATGIVSRLTFGAICDRIGGLRTLVLGSALQGIALLLFLPFDGLTSLFIVSGLFGLFQGGIVPSYAIIVREHFPAREAGMRVGTIIMFTLFGMALGGWMSGKIYDMTLSYHAAFLNGIAWNAVNLTIAITLLRLTRTRGGGFGRGTPRSGAAAGA